MNLSSTEREFEAVQLVMAKLLLQSAFTEHLLA